MRPFIIISKVIARAISAIAFVTCARIEVFAKVVRVPGECLEGLLRLGAHRGQAGNILQIRLVVQNLHK